MRIVQTRWGAFARAGPATADEHEQHGRLAHRVSDGFIECDARCDVVHIHEHAFVGEVAHKRVVQRAGIAGAVIAAIAEKHASLAHRVCRRVGRRAYPLGPRARAAVHSYQCTFRHTKKSAVGVREIPKGHGPLAAIHCLQHRTHRACTVLAEVLEPLERAPFFCELVCGVGCRSSLPQGVSSAHEPPLADAHLVPGPVPGQQRHFHRH